MWFIAVILHIPILLAMYTQEKKKLRSNLPHSRETTRIPYRAQDIRVYYIVVNYPE